jgi:uncharacterized membrane protein
VSSRPSQFDREEREVEFARALAFSDGVFAFAITLLVTTLDVPDLSGPDIGTQLWHQFDDIAPRLGTFFLSFAVIGMLWLRHHRLLSRVRQLDTRALVLNLVLLAFIVLMPFSTEMMGRYGDTAIAVTTYAVNISLEAVAFAALWWYCARHEMLGETLTVQQMRNELLLRAVVPAVFVLSIPLAFFVSTTVAAFSWLLSVPGQGLLERRLLARGELPPEDRFDPPG